MKGVVDFFLGLAVLIVGVVLLFLAFLSVRNEQSLLVEAVRQSRDTARLASVQDVGNTSSVQCRQADGGQTNDLEAAVRALFFVAGQIWGPEELVVAVGDLRDPQSQTYFCGDSIQCEVDQQEITQCFERFGQTNGGSFGYFVKGAAFGNFCGIFENNNLFTGEGGDNPPQNPECYVHDDCQPTEYCYDYTCYDCPEGYKRRGVTLQAFWFLRNFRLASIYKLFFSLLQAELMGTEGIGDPPPSHPFCEPCSNEEMHHCNRSGGGPNGQESNENQSVENPN
jgi:hypothetical protein